MKPIRQPLSRGPVFREPRGCLSGRKQRLTPSVHRSRRPSPFSEVVRSGRRMTLSFHRPAYPDCPAALRARPGPWCARAFTRLVASATRRTGGPWRAAIVLASTQHLHVVPRTIADKNPGGRMDSS